MNTYRDSKTIAYNQKANALGEALSKELERLGLDIRPLEHGDLLVFDPSNVGGGGISYRLEPEQTKLSSFRWAPTGHVRIAWFNHDRRVNRKLTEKNVAAVAQAIADDLGHISAERARIEAERAKEEAIKPTVSMLHNTYRTYSKSLRGVYAGPNGVVVEIEPLEPEKAVKLLAFLEAEGLVARR